MNHRNLRGRAASFASALLALVLTTACVDISINGDGEGVSGSGDLVTREIDASGFSKLNISHAYDATIRAGDSFSVSVTADDNLIDSVDIAASGDTLRADLDGVDSLRNVTLRLDVTMPALTEVELSGASHADIEGFGSIEELRLDASGASSFNGSIDVGRLELRLSGASRAELRGNAGAADLEADGASHLELRDLEIETASANLSGASSGTVTVSGALDVDLSGAARLEYGGDPQLGDVDTSGGATLSSR